MILPYVSNEGESAVVSHGFFYVLENFIFEFFHMKSVFIFNPETDIVLGLNKDSYTPNKHIAYFRKRLSLLPALYANAGDIIVVTGSEDNEFSFYPFFDIAEAKELLIVRLDNLKSFINDESEPIAFRPWGWNREILKRLSRIIFPSPYSHRCRLLNDCVFFQTEDSQLISSRSIVTIINFNHPDIFKQLKISTISLIPPHLSASKLLGAVQEEE